MKCERHFALAPNRQFRNTVKVGDNKYFFGLAKIGTKGQIVIPKEARDRYNMQPGDHVLVLGDETSGVWVASAETFDKLAPGALAEILKAGGGFAK